MSYFTHIWVMSASLSVPYRWPNSWADPDQTWHTDSSWPRDCFRQVKVKDKIQRHLEDRELNRARSKPDPVDRPARTACTIVPHCNGTQYCSTETVLLIFRVHDDTLYKSTFTLLGLCRWHYNATVSEISCSLTTCFAIQDAAFVG